MNAFFAASMARQTRDLLREQEELLWVEGRRVEIKMLVKTPCSLVFRMNHDGANADDVRCRKNMAQRIDQEGSAQAFSLPVKIDCEARDQDDGDRVSGQPL